MQKVRLLRLLNQEYVADMTVIDRLINEMKYIGMNTSQYCSNDAWLLMIINTMLHADESRL